MVVQYVFNARPATRDRAASLATLHQGCCPLYRVQSSGKHNAFRKKQGIQRHISVRKATLRVKI
jgi:hypothetical protein